MLLAKNRKALYNYEVVEKFLAGIVLKGYEVKAVRESKANLEGSYVRFDNGELFAVGIHIGRYSKQSQRVSEEDSRQPRKLLVTKAELEKVAKELNQKGKTAVPLALVLRNNMIKLEFAIVKGRKALGKKHLAKERQLDKDLQQQRKDLINLR